MSTRDPKLPEQISHYRVISALGAGGMGEVYLADDARLGRRVAIKVLPPVSTRNPDSVRRFTQEARAASALNHPNIVTVHDIGESESGHFLVMELVSGSTLRAFTRQSLRLSELLAWFEQMAKALMAAHAAGITHRDLKPENIMIREDGYVKVLDFGLARLAPMQNDDETVTNVTQPGQVMGTVRYMSPEQARGETVGSASDIFSLGLVFYELAAGRYPFQAENAVGFLHAINTQNPPPLDRPEALNRLILSMLAKNAADRPSARDVAGALSAFARGEAVETGMAVLPVKPVESAAQPPKADHWIAVLPFKSRTGDTLAAALAEGLTEDVAAGFSRFSYLRVLAPGATAKLTEDDPRTLGTLLGARYVVEGNLRQNGPVCRLTVRLVETATGSQLWSQAFDRRIDADNLFALQDEWVSAIVARVADQHGALVHDMVRTFRNKKPEELTPHEAVLSVFSYHERLSSQEHARLRSVLERLVRESPDSSDCWAMLASLYSDEFMFGFPGEPDPMSRARTAAQRAFELAPTNPLACQAQFQSLFFRKEWHAFRPVAERALVLNPLDSATVAFAGILLACSGAWDQGCGAVEGAIRNNPNHPGWYWMGAVFRAFHLEDYQGAVDFAQRLNMPGYFWGPAALASAYGHLDQLEAAGMALRELLSLKPDFAQTARSEFEKWISPELADRFVAGLAKAGCAAASADRSTAAGASGWNSGPGDGFWIAVPPFRAHGTHPDVAALGESFAEEIIAGLCRFPYLRVLTKGARGARYILEGNLRQAGQQLRVAVQLIETTTGANLWAENYSRTFSPEAPFAVQENLVPMIVSTIGETNGVLTHSMWTSLRDRDPQTLTPHEAMLRCFGGIETQSPQELKLAVGTLERAVEQEPRNSGCLAMLAVVHATSGYGLGYSEHPAPLEAALSYAQRAVAAEPSSHLAHHALATVQFFRKEAVAFHTAAERALALNPMDGYTLASIGMRTAFLGDWERGCDMVRRSMALNPRHPGWYWFPLFTNAYRKRDFAGALGMAQQINMPGVWAAAMMLAAIHGQLGNQKEARQAARELAQSGVKNPRELMARYWSDEDLLDLVEEGWRKAGLDESSPNDSGSSRPSTDGFWVAVLPFEATGSEAAAMFANGLFEETLTGMARFSYLRLIARSSVRQYAGARSDIRTIGRELGARYVLEGSVRQAGAQVRLTVQISDVSTGAQLWTETFNRPFDPDRIFALQDELAPRIVSTISDSYGVLIRAMNLELRRKPDEDLTPHDAVLLGCGVAVQLSGETHLRARNALERAVAAEPDNPDCWSWLSIMYLFEWVIGLNPLPDSITRSVTAARKAVEAAPTSAVAHGSLALAYFQAKRRREFRLEAERSMELNPWDAGILVSLALPWAQCIDWDEGEALAQRGFAYNPSLPPIMYRAAFWNQYRQRKYAEALSVLDKAAMVRSAQREFMRAVVLGQLGETAAAQEALQESFRLRPDFQEKLHAWLDTSFVPELAEQVLDGLYKAGLEKPAAAAKTDSAPSHRSGTDGFWVAVLPFEATGSEAAAMFANGLFEETLTGMSRFPYLRLIARSSVRKYAGARADVRTIGSELGARYVMEGSVRQAGPQIRLTVQISDVNTGAQLWTETFNRAFDPEQIFALQDELAPRIVCTVSDSFGVLVRAMNDDLRRKPDAELTPHDAVLLAFGYIFRHTPEDHLRARTALERAVEAAPDDANCWAMLSTIYLNEHFHGVNRLADPVGRAMEAARRAVEFGPANSMAHYASACANFFAGRLTEFQAGGERAIQLNPWDGLTLAWVGTLWSLRIDWDQGEALILRAQSYNPTHPDWYHNAVFWRRYQRGEYQAALALLQRNRASGGDYYLPIMRAAVLGQLGQTGPARDALQEAFRLRPDFPDQLRSWLEMFFAPEMVEHIFGGLRKAGLDTPASGQHPGADGFWVAVLPFEATGSEAAAAFANGLFEETLTGMSRFSYLRLIARSSVRKYAGVRSDVRTIGRELGARYVMEGSVRQAGAQVRLTVQISDVSTGSQLWTETFNRPFDPEQVFALQDELAPRIVSTVSDPFGVLVRAMSEELRRKPDEELTPHDAVLLGCGFVRLVRAEEHLRARNALERAVQAAPDNANCQAMLSIIYYNEQLHGLNPLPDPVGRALKAARRAIDLDPTNVMAHFARASAHFLAKQLPQFRADAERAIELNPWDSLTLGWLGTLWAFGLDWDEGERWTVRARAYNPAHPPWFHLAGFWNRYRRGDYAAALTLLDGMRASGGNYNAALMRAAVLGQLGQASAAREACEELLRLRPDYRASLEAFFQPDMVEHILDGLRKAGLDEPAEPVKVDSAEQRAGDGFWVAVLPFESTGSDAAAGFTAGLFEETLTGMSRFSYLRVIARSSVRQYAGSRPDVRTLGKALGARYVMEGSVRQAGAQIRVTVQISDAKTGAQLWTETFNRPFDPDQVFALQDELAPRIVSTVADSCGVLVRAMGEELRRKPDAELTPYDAVLLGCGAHFLTSPELHQRARTALERAVQMAPGDANCWLWLASVYYLEVSVELNPLPDSIGRALAAARRAVDLDPVNATARLALACCHFFTKQHAEFRVEARRALELNPWDGSALVTIGLLWGHSIDWEEGEELVTRGFACNPTQPGWAHSTAFWNQFHRRNYPAALEVLRKLGASGYHWAPLQRAATLGHMGESGPAREALAELLRLRPDFPQALRQTLEVWHQPDMVEHILDGLRKAGLGLEPPSAPRANADGFGVAVAGFQAEGGDAAGLAAGLAEEIFTALSRFSYLRVYPNGAAGARYVLEGTIRQAGAQVRVSARLNDTETGMNLWTEAYTRPYAAEKVFEVQDDLAPVIASAIGDAHGALPRSVSNLLRTRKPEELTPYEAVLRSFGYTERGTPEELVLARDALRVALAQDPGYADALAMLGFLLVQDYAHGFDRTPDALTEGTALARRAVELAPASSLAWRSLAQALFFQRDGGFAAAAERAVALNPQDGDTLAFVGELLLYIGSPARGLELSNAAKRLAPNHAGWYWYADTFHAEFNLHDSAAALGYLNRIQLDQHYPLHLFKASVLGHLGQKEAAALCWARFVDLRPDMAERVRAHMSRWWSRKQVERLVEGLRQAGLGPSVEAANNSAAKAMRPMADESPSLAVLPFANLGGDKDQEYFSDGLAEEILNLLAQLPGLKTIARTSSFAFRGKEDDVRSIAGALNVTHVVQGSVRRSGDRIRVSAQLIAASDGAALWSERYDRRMDDLFALQDEIAASIAAQLKVRVAPGSTRPRKQPNLEAYEAYLRYRQHQWGFTPEAFERSRECLERAIALDPEFALPYVGLADHYFAQTQFAAASGLVPRVREMAARALALDPELSEAQAMHGILAGMFDRNWAEAERWFAKALAHPAVHWHVRVWYAWFCLQALGRSEEARRHVEIALTDNPLNPMVHWAKAAVMEGLESATEAAGAYRKILEVEPGNWMATWAFALQQARQGEFDEARRLAGRAWAAAPWAAYARGTMAGVLRHEGKAEEAEALLSGSQSPVAKACAAIAVSDAEGATTALIEAMEQDYVKSVVMLIGPHRPLLKESQRWRELMRSLGVEDDGAGR